MARIVCSGSRSLVLAKLTVLGRNVVTLTLELTGHCGFSIQKCRDGKYQMILEFAIAALILTICGTIHVSGLLIMVEWLISHQNWIQRKVTFRSYTPMFIGVFGAIAALHVLEAFVWAAFYYGNQLFDDLETSLYFSLGTYTTIGYGDVVLPQRWRLLGAVEGISGVLLCGLSTAFIFAIVNALFKIRVDQPQMPRT